MLLALDQDMPFRSTCTAIVVTLVSIAACSPPDREPPIEESIQNIVSAAQPAAVGDDVWDEVRRFYQQRGHTAAWVQQQDLSKAATALRVLRSAPDHGLAANYGEDEIARTMADDDDSDAEALSASDLAPLDVRITSGLLALGHDVAMGRTSPQSIDARWKKRRTPPDFVALLTQAAAGDPSTWLSSVQPRHPEYAALQKTLSFLRQQPAPPDAERLNLLALNLERWRWMPDDLGVRHILVNVPAFHLAARENGRAVLDMKVVVGEADGEHETPIFSAEMKTVVFSPYWNVPDSIVEGETAPALARDPSFLERNEIEILRRTKSGTERVDPSAVDWEDGNELKALLFRQRPGPRNALGHVKFLFPNPFSVYLHDTPADSLFARRGRALSHGCVRVEQPEMLARYLLRDQPEWDDDRIREAMHAGVEKPVAVKAPIPVHIVYFTAWPTDDGGFQTWTDVYGFDSTQQSAAVSAVTAAARPLN